MNRALVRIFSVLLVCLVSTSVWGQSTKASLDTVHSKIGFTASTMLFDVDGDFKKYQLFLDGAHNNLSKVKVEIDAASVFTSNKKRDEHLKSPDFFDVKNHKMITFVSDSIRQSGDTVTINGTLTILGKAKQVTIPFKVKRVDMGGKTTVVYRGKTEIDRSDFGVGADSVAAKISLKDEVELDLLLVATP